MSEFSGNKYHKKLVALGGEIVMVDVYRIIDSYDIRDGGCQHALKKILMPGSRGKASYIQDLREARDAITASILLEEQKESRSEHG